MKLACILWECEFVDFELGYKLHLDDEWLREVVTAGKPYAT